MNTKNRYLIDFDILSAIEDDTHIYATDLNNTIICMNITGRCFFKKTLAKEPDGLTIHELFEGNEQAIEHIETENKLVSDTQQAHSFYNRVHLAHSTWLDFITIKMPIYHTDNTLAGVLGISNYVEKRSALPAYEMGLTKREIECIYLLLEGLSYKDIAKKMGISSRTVESYLTNIKNKLGCENSAHLFDKLNHAQLKTDIKEMMDITSTHLSSNTMASTINNVSKKNKK